MFDSVPTGGDVYVLKMILHDWPDDKAVEFLQSVRSVAEVGTGVLVIDCVIPDHDREFFGHWTDLEMLLLQAGRERTAPELRSLLERAGFRITRWVPTASPVSFLGAEAISLRYWDHTGSIEQLKVRDRNGSRTSAHVDTAVSAQRDGLLVR